MKAIINREIKFFYLSEFLFNIARVLPHAVLTVILLNKGLTYSDISFIQSMYMFSALILEFPSGIISDLISEKKIYLLSIILIIISYSIILCSTSVFFLSIAWFLYGASAAGMSGSLEGYFIKKMNNDSVQIKDFSVNYNYIIFFSGLIGGFLGSILYRFVNMDIYLYSLILFFIAFINILYNIKGNTSTLETMRPSLSQLKNDITKMLYHKKLMILILMVSSLQIVFQSFYQFWQIIFLEKSMSYTVFGVFYIIFQMISILANYIYSKYDIKNWNYLGLPITISTLFLISLLTNNVIFILFFLIFQIPLNIFNNQLNVDIRKECNPKALSSLISFLGTCMNIIAMIVMWIASILLSDLNIITVLIILLMIFIILNIILYVYYSRYKF